MLKEIRDDNRENDAEHMKPVSQTPVRPADLVELICPRIDERAYPRQYPSMYAPPRSIDTHVNCAMSKSSQMLYVKLPDSR